ncbi:MAG: radical SAM protein [Terriglobales bacterium]|jgi:DNA repair photolyase
MASPAALSLFPIAQDSVQPKLVGIARLASQGESLREGHDVEYFTLKSKSLLNRVVSKRGVPFTWAINPYRGCEFGCKYCYARYTHEFMEMRDGVAFEQKIFVKEHAADLLRQELRQVKPGESIAIGTATDPYQPAERRYETTRGILEELALHEGLEVGIITKSNMILRDIEVLRELGKRNRLFVHITITTVDEKLARLLEPRAPRPDLRLDAVRMLSESGLNVGVNCCPVIPGITDSPKDLDKVVRAAAEAGAKRIFSNPLFLKPCSAAVFMPFLEKEFPHLVEQYKQRYGEKAFLGPAYGKRLGKVLTTLRHKYGMGERKAQASVKLEPAPEAGTQMTMF